jgi:hypothetical protein
MRWILVIVLIVGVLSASGQETSRLALPGHTPSSDDIVLSPLLLAQQLTMTCSTDRQKVQAIFSWITDNIGYRTRPVVRNRKRSKQQPVIIEPVDDTAALKPLDERVAETVLEDRVAVCDGYARLFKTLCFYAGLEAEVVQGYARTEATARIQRFRPNHSWNAVKIDSAWHLLDVTWASGYITWRGNEFVKQLDSQYFLSAPERFIREHYPDDIRWTLMEDPPLMPEFRHSPFKQKSFTKYLIRSYQPEKGIIAATHGDTILVTLETTSAARDRNISSDPFLDTSLYTTASSALLVPETAGNTISYRYIADRPGVKWLYLLYNDDIIMRYKLELKSDPSLTRKD